MTDLYAAYLAESRTCQERDGNCHHPEHHTEPYRRAWDGYRPRDSDDGVAIVRMTYPGTFTESAAYEVLAVSWGGEDWRLLDPRDSRTWVGGQELVACHRLSHAWDVCRWVGSPEGHNPRMTGSRVAPGTPTVAEYMAAAAKEAAKEAAKTAAQKERIDQMWESYLKG